MLLGAEAEALAPQVRNAGAVFVGASSPVAAGDYATGGNHVLPTGGWARSLGGLGLETFLKPVTIQRLTPEGLRVRAAGRRGARRRRGNARARGGGAPMRELSQEFTGYGWAPSTADIARLAGIHPMEVVRFDGNVAAAPLPSSRPGTIAGRARARSTPTRTAATRSCSTRSPGTRASRRRTSSSARARTI